MRASTARLTNSPVRLADLQFPQVSRLIHRTRLAFIHLDNLLAYAKRDRDGRIDGYLAAHRGTSRHHDHRSAEAHAYGTGTRRSDLLRRADGAARVDVYGLRRRLPATRHRRQ